jgi:thioredoxin-related protein
MAKNKILCLILIVIVMSVSAIAKTPVPVSKDVILKVAADAKSSEVKWYDSYATAVAIAKFENKPMLVDFTAEWCVWCVKMDTNVFSNKEIAAKLQKIVCVRIDVDKDIKTASAYAVKSLPRVLVVNTYSEVVGDWLGYRGPKDFSKLLDDVMEYTKEKTGAIEAPKVAVSGDKPTAAVKTVSIDLSNKDVLVEQLASKDPAVRQAVIAQLATVPSEAMLIAVAGLESKYLGIRIASWELMKKIYQTPIEYDPWASIKQRSELLKSLNKAVEKTTEKISEKSAEKPTEK